MHVNALQQGFMNGLRTALPIVLVEQLLEDMANITTTRDILTKLDLPALRLYQKQL